jgi:hypothetical protein
MDWNIHARTAFGPCTRTTLIAAAICVAGCASTQNKGEQCQRLGLPNGSSAYTECVAEGPDQYSESHALTGGHFCSAPPSSPSGRCPGCSVSCGEQQAYCTRGAEMWLDTPDLCVKPAACRCTK